MYEIEKGVAMRRHTWIRRCNPVSAKEQRGYERLLAAIYAKPVAEVPTWNDIPPFPEEATMHYLAARPISDVIAPTSCIWGMAEKNPTKWN